MSSEDVQMSAAEPKKVISSWTEYLAVPSEQKEEALTGINSLLHLSEP